MFGGKKIKLDKNLLERAEAFAAEAGYASVEEFIAHILEREIAKSNSEDESEEEVKERLKGLGYIS
jgi:metal-responsive CopG/Arc/MetJ family transcriptional regulator